MSVIERFMLGLATAGATVALILILLLLTR